MGDSEDVFIGNKTMAPALAGGFFTTEPPGKPSIDDTLEYRDTESGK